MSVFLAAVLFFFAVPGPRAQTNFSYVAENGDTCIDVCFITLENAILDMFRLAGHRPAMTGTHCAGFSGS